MSFRFADAAAEWTAMRTNSKRIYTELVDRHNKEQLVKSLPNIVKRYKFTQNYYVRRSSRYLLTKYFHMPKMPMSPFLLYCKDRAEAEKLKQKPTKNNYYNNDTDARTFFSARHGKEWRSMSANQRDVYNRKYEARFRQYKKNHDRILRSLDKISITKNFKT